MNIAHVLSSFGMGGQERVALDLARGQLAAGHQVFAVSLAEGPEGPHAENFRSAGARVFSLPKGAGFDVTLLARLHALLRREAVSIVHTHNPQPLVYGAPAGKLAGARVVHTKHGANPDGARRRWLRRGASEFADAYVAVSNTTGELARRNRECRFERLHVIPNGIDLAQFAPDPNAKLGVCRELGIPEGARIIGTVGRLAKEKNQRLLIAAAAPLLSDSVRLVLVGTGPEQEALQTFARSLAHGKYVHFAGARNDVGRVLAMLDVFALSSLTEGLPLVIPEAMAAALPIVSTRVGGIPDVVEDGKIGFLVPSGDEHALRESLSKLLEDPTLAAWMGTRARSVALSRYSASRMTADYMTLYERVLSTNARAPHASYLEGQRWTSLRSRLSL
ncbi:MAG TPA: glycosyltransferase [Polyangiaceae bacterium]|nr:glycosyltransferase [Polyangiaceae bacterium]